MLLKGLLFSRVGKHVNRQTCSRNKHANKSAINNLSCPNSRKGHLESTFHNVAYSFAKCSFSRTISLNGLFKTIVFLGIVENFGLSVWLSFQSVRPSKQAPGKKAKRILEQVV